ncbi:MAG: ATP-binding protein [Moorellales bacterium]
MLSIRWRLTLINTTVLILTIFVFGFALYFILEQYLWRQTDRALAARAAEITYRLEAPRPPFGRRDLVDLPYLSVFLYPDTFVQLVDAQGRIVAKSPNLGSEDLPVPPQTLETARLKGPFFQTVKTNGQRVRLYNLPVVAADYYFLGVLQVGRVLEPTYHFLNRLVLVLVILGLGMIGLATGAGYYLARAALRPVEHLTQVATAISRTQDLNRRVSYSGPEDELGRLARAFNQMLESLAAAQKSLTEAYAAQRRFVADVSHELRTPLTVIRGSLELLQQLPPADPGRTEILADAVSEAERMSRLLNNLLLLARADAGLKIERAPVDLGALVQEVARQAPHLGPATFLTRDLEVLAGARVLGHADYLKQLLLILLDNAFKYTPPEGTVTLGAATRTGGYEISVADTGPGIPAEEIPRIFDRFFRGSASRAGSTGLGLAIARWIAEEHGGRIEVISAPGQGATFTVWLPAA